MFFVRPQIVVQGNPEGIPQFGLVAEEVEKINPDLVVRDADGKVYTVRYEAVNAMLLNEFLKEHRKVQDQDRKVEEQETTIAQLKATVTEQQKGMEVLSANLKEHESQIQKVTQRLERATPLQVVDRE
jgi:septal ring factor EnvC (AmiA/AmiB activator)